MKAGGAALMCTDQSAAFNLVKADIIVSELRVFGVDEASLLLIRSYLTGRSTSCTVGSSKSSVTNLRSGVGGGSVVGPLFFVATLCDVSVVAACAMDRLGRDHALDVLVHLITYADDVSAIFIGDSGAEIQVAIDNLLEEFSAYFSSARLAMNPDKSELILFRRGRQQQELHVGGQPETSKLKLLGVTVEKGYQFMAHAHMISAGVKAKIQKMSRVVQQLDLKKRTRVTESIVLSSLSYCLAIWGFLRKTRKKCQVAMNQAIRLVLDLDTRDSMTDGLRTLQWPNMDNLWRLEQITALTRVVKTRVPDIIHEIITRASNRRYYIRADGLRSSWWPHNVHGERAFVNKAVEVYNDLRVGQRTWFDDRERRLMTKSEVRQTLKLELFHHFGNENLH